MDDYRLATNPAGDIVLVYAIREFGETYACDVNDAMEAEVKPATLKIPELKKTK